MTLSGKRQAVISRLVKYPALAVALALALFATQSAHAQNYRVLHDFGGTDGATPYAGLILDTAGNLYGTSTAGGASNLGTVFKLDPTGQVSVLHSFTGLADGATPYGALILDAAGNLYGTTTAGGSANFGTVFKLDTTGKVSLLHSFTGAADGSAPYAGVILDAAGNLYGTTAAGGPANSGSVFKLDTTGKETVLYAFTGGADGGIPIAPLVLDLSGNLYGTTNDGGKLNTCFLGRFGCGVVFKLDTSGNESVLYTFTGGTDGGTPYSGGLVLDASGNLYGTTAAGGADDNGVVFKLDTTGTETVFYSFGNMGSEPFGGLVLDSAGNLYGTTENGDRGFGTVFKLNTIGKYTELHAFTGATDGANPYAGLVSDAAGNLYGTTAAGGGSNVGTVFEIESEITGDFTFGTITSAPANATVAAGSSVTYTIPVAAVGNFSSTVTLTCTSGLPSKASCSEASATPTTPATLTISTQANSLAPKFPAADRNPLAPLTTGVTFLIACLLLALQFRRQPRPFSQLTFGFSLAALAFVFALAGCSSSGGGGGGGGGGGNTGTPSGAYTVRITGTSGSQTHTTTVALTVSP